ncbi:MAG: hypothetical protein AAF529_24165 [Pseudomonadota bacterium]
MSALLLVLFGFVAIKIWQQFADGPYGPITGGSFASGTWVDGPVDDWRVLEGSFDFELVGQGSSREAGGILLGEQVYISCDLGFTWARLPEGTTRTVLQIIWWFKDWHHHAVEDGRVVIRKDNTLYPVQITRVTDPTTVAALKTTMETLAAEYFGGELGPRPVEPPNDVWFFAVANRGREPR